LSDGIVHAGLIARWLDGRWAGVLIEGPSGCGKSDLALRSLGEGFRLVADDRVIVWTSGGEVYGRAPPTLAGAMEVRGVDVLVMDALRFARIALIARSGDPERIPEPVSVRLAGAAIPLVLLDFRHASAPAKLSRALALFAAGPNRRI